jgi:hypothetical protein
MRRLLLLGLSSALLLQVTPLWAAPAARRTTSAKAAQVAASTIDGKADCAAGQASLTQVQLRSLETGELVGTTTCNSLGDFSFPRRQPGRYAVELVNGSGAIVGSSAAIVAPGATPAVVTVAPTMAVTNRTAPAVAAASTAALVTTTAAAATALRVDPASILREE